MKRVLIFGPTSWDTVIKINEYPANGEFAQAQEREERPGGAGLNIAAAVSTAGIETHFFSYVGSDDLGKELKKHLSKSNISHLHVNELAGPSLHAMITVDSEGERTIFALEKNRFAELNFKVKFEDSDLVVFPVWRSFYATYLRDATLAGAFTIVGPAAVTDLAVKANLIVGSENDVADFKYDEKRFSSAVITKGSQGVSVFNNSEEKSLHAKEVEVVDATGAGDSFLSGILVGLAKEKELTKAVEIGINWASLAISQSGSIPPSWRRELDVS